MSWSSAILKAIVIFAYFVLFAVWLPSWVMGLRVIAVASSPIRDGIAVAVWALAMGAGLFGLRKAQRQGLI